VTEDVWRETIGHGVGVKATIGAQSTRGRYRPAALP